MTYNEVEVSLNEKKDLRKDKKELSFKGLNSVKDFTSEELKLLEELKNCSEKQLLEHEEKIIRIKNEIKKHSYKINKEKVTHEIGIDLVNIFNTKNILSFSYAPNNTPSLEDDIAENYQLGFLPIFYYKIDF